MSDIELVQASALCGEHVDRIARLPGRLHADAGFPMYWSDTDAPITMIIHKRNGTVKVRRHPDSHGDHDLAATDMVPLVRKADPQ